uniref:uncharacterized protein LOC122610151 n=1 Tax=Erigeron canadensis TaxID=72917 RepID=UPI001CB979A7|nr:uncharacterized protein LOC122610151 [Erigeron canadensis]
MARPWTADETINLARAWLDVAEDPNVEAFQQQRTFWSRVREVFINLQNHQGEQRSLESVQGKWRKMRHSIHEFEHIYACFHNEENPRRAELALEEYRMTHPDFLYLPEWHLLRASAKIYDVILSNMS